MMIARSSTLTLTHTHTHPQWTSSAVRVQSCGRREEKNTAGEKEIRREKRKVEVSNEKEQDRVELGQQRNIVNSKN